MSEPQSQPFVQSQAAHSHLQNTGTTTNLGVSSPAASISGYSIDSVKRTPSHKPPPRPSGGSSSGHGQGSSASPLKTMELAPASHRKKRKLSEKEIPVNLGASLAESAIYSQMLELESYIDSALARKKIEAEEFLKNPLRVSKLLRLYVFNTFAGQGGEATPEGSTEPPSWTLKITGRILEDGIDPTDLHALCKCPYPKFSSFFKKMTVYLDQNIYPENHVILWERSRSSAMHEGFEVKRKGDKEFTAVIRLEMDFVPEKHGLGTALQEILGIEVETHPRIIAALWQYIKSRKLQIPEDTSSFICDTPLQSIFGEEKVKFSAVAQKITNLLASPKPIHVEHRIRLSGNCPAGNSCYDILVDVPLVAEMEIPNFLANLEKTMDLKAFDQSISAAMKKLNDHCRRRDFFIGFSQSPAEFTNVLLTSQARDLKLLDGETYRNTEKERRSEFYNQPWVEDALIRYLNRKPSAGSEPSGSK